MLIKDFNLDDLIETGLFYFDEKKISILKDLRED